MAFPSPQVAAWLSLVGARRRRWLVVGILAVSVLSGNLLIGRAAAQRAGGMVQPAPTVAPLDRALNLVAQARSSFQQIEDYTCTLVKREVVRGQAQPENVVALKVRNRPFSIHMRWQQPHALQGQEACWVTGRNNGMMRVKGPGLLGAVGFVNLDPKDARATATSRHSITEAGIGNVIERYAERWEAEKKVNRTRVRINEYEFNKRKCIRVESVHPGSKPGDFYSYRNIVYFDKENHLPIRTESYDWPKEGGKADGELLEAFSFVDLRLNVRLDESAFNH